MNSVQSVYQQLLREGKASKDAAKIAQEKTGLSLVTGQPIKHNLGTKVEYRGQYK